MSSFISRRCRDLIALAVLTGIVAVFYYQTILGGLLPIPTDALIGRYHPWKDKLIAEYPQGVPYKNFLITDPVRQQIPWRKIVIEAYLNHENPGWDPGSMGGSPLDLNLQAGAFYPLNLIFFRIPFPLAWTLLIMSQTLGFVILTYLYLRLLGLIPFSAMMGAVVAGFSGFSIAWLLWGTIVATIMWLPLLLILVKLAGKANTLIKQSILIGLGCFTWYAMFTAGHLQMSIYITGLTLVYAFYEYSIHRKLFLLIQPTISGGILLIAGYRYFFRLVSFLTTTVRGTTTTTWQSEGFFIPVRHLIQFFAPDFFGNPGHFNYWGSWNYGELVGYVGITGLIMVTVAITVYKIKIRFWLVSLLILLLLSLNTPIAWLPYWLKVPYWSSLQPTRLLGIIDFCLAVLTAYGFEALINKTKGNIRKSHQFQWGFLILTMGLTLLTYLGIGIAKADWRTIALRNLIVPAGLCLVTVGLLRLVEKLNINKSLLRNGIIIILGGMLTADLIRFGWRFIPFTPEAYFYPETQILIYLQNQPKPFRVMNLETELAPTNSLTWYGIEQVGGYNPVYTERYARFFNALENGLIINQPLGFQRMFDPTHFSSPLLKFMDVSYVLSLKPLDSPQVKLVQTEGETRLYEVLNPLSRWYLADRVIGGKSGDEVLAHLIKDNLEGKPAFVEQTTPGNTWGGGQVKPRLYTANVQVIEVVTEAQTFLVNSTAWDAGWKVYIDGVEAIIYRTNYLFMGTVVPEGTHVVRFKYK